MQKLVIDDGPVLRPFPSRVHSRRGALAALIAFAGLGSLISAFGVNDSSSILWNEYLLNPDNHSHLANGSYAGYRSGEVAPPAVPVVVDIRDFGGVPDGNSPNPTDNSPAFQRAIEAAASRGGGAVFVPEGVFLLGGFIHLNKSNVVLRGTGPGKTILVFENHLTSLFGAQRLGASSRWNWAGGLVWMAPDTNFSTGKDLKKVFSPVTPKGYGSGAPAQAWEYFHAGAELAKVVLPQSSEIPRGERELPVPDASHFQEGEYYLLTWDNTPDNSLLREIGEHPLLAEAPPQAFGAWLTSCGDPSTTPPIIGNYPRWQWPVQVAKVNREKNTVTLKQPLRVAIRQPWNCRFWEPGRHVRESGIEDLTILLKGTPDLKHNQGFGWNGVYVSNAVNCWIRNVEVQNAENGFIVTGSKNISILDTTVRGTMPMHHPYAARCETQDCLWDGFVIDLNTPDPGPLHGINTEWLSAGNVWTRGQMKQGTFDSHGGMAFDYLRTDISVKNDDNCGPGGAKQAAFYTGRRMAHWNIRITGSNREEGSQGLYIYQPRQFVRGVLCGIQGAPVADLPPYLMPDGDKDVRIADHDKIPEVAPNLYDAQFQLRRDREGIVQLAWPNNGLHAPGDVSLHAAAAARNGASIRRVDFLADNKIVASAFSPPWSAVWADAQPGAYSMQVKVTDSNGKSLLSTRSPLTIGWRIRIEGNHPGWTYSDGSFVEEPGANHSGGSLTVPSDGKSASASFTFTGTNVRLVTSGSPKKGTQKAIVYLNDMTSPLVELPGLNKKETNHEYWNSGRLPNGTHTVKFQKASETMNIDYIEIDSTIPMEKSP